MVDFWQSKTLSSMTEEEWESLCDGCGKCCLNKLEDADTAEIYYTDVACSYLNLDTARCKDYNNRKRNVPACLNLTADKLADCTWLPESCAYRLLHEGKTLPNWHPLVSGDPRSTLRTGQSVVGRVISETYVHADDLEERIVRWV